MILKHPILFFTWHHIGMEIKQTSMRTHSAAVPQWMVFLPKNPSLCLKWVARDSKTPTLDFIPVFTPTSGIRSSLRPAGAVSIFNSIPKISFDARTQWPWYFVSVSAEHRPSIILDSGLSFTIITESPPCWAFLLFFFFLFLCQWAQSTVLIFSLFSSLQPAWGRAEPAATSCWMSCWIWPSAKEWWISTIVSRPSAPDVSTWSRLKWVGEATGFLTRRVREPLCRGGAFP